MDEPAVRAELPAAERHLQFLDMVSGLRHAVLRDWTVGVVPVFQVTDRDDNLCVSFLNPICYFHFSRSENSARTIFVVLSAAVLALSFYFSYAYKLTYE